MAPTTRSISVGIGSGTNPGSYMQTEWGGMDPRERGRGGEIGGEEKETSGSKPNGVPGERKG